MRSTPTVLIAEPDASLRRLLTRRLETEGLAVTAVNLSEIIDAVDDSAADAVVFAVPARGDTLGAVRERTDAIVIAMLPTNTEHPDALDALEAGADDFVVKPFSPRELVARLRAHLRHRPVLVDRLVFGDLAIDTACREVTVCGTPVPLPAKEFDLLAFLASSPRRVFSRGQLMAQVWGVDAAVTTATITEHIRRLRNRLERNPKQPEWIETVWSVGYRFNPGNLL